MEHRNGHFSPQSFEPVGNTGSSFQATEDISFQVPPAGHEILKGDGGFLKLLRSFLHPPMTRTGRSKHPKMLNVSFRNMHGVDFLDTQLIWQLVSF